MFNLYRCTLYTTHLSPLFKLDPLLTSPSLALHLKWGGKVGQVQPDADVKVIDRLEFWANFINPKKITLSGCVWLTCWMRRGSRVDTISSGSDVQHSHHFIGTAWFWKASSASNSKTRLISGLFFLFRYCFDLVARGASVSLPVLPLPASRWPRWQGQRWSPAWRARGWHSPRFSVS